VAFVPGDLIKQRYPVINGSARLVIALTANPDVIVVFDYVSVTSDQPKFRRVFTWSHERVQAATAIARSEAELLAKELNVFEAARAQW